MAHLKIIQDRFPPLHFAIVFLLGQSKRKPQLPTCVKGAFNLPFPLLPSSSEP